MVGRVVVSPYFSERAIFFFNCVLQDWADNPDVANIITTLNFVNICIYFLPVL